MQKFVFPSEMRISPKRMCKMKKRSKLIMRNSQQCISTYTHCSSVILWLLLSCTSYPNRCWHTLKQVLLFGLSQKLSHRSYHPVERNVGALKPTPEEILNIRDDTEIFNNNWITSSSFWCIVCLWYTHFALIHGKMLKLQFCGNSFCCCCCCSCVAQRPK